MRKAQISFVADQRLCFDYTDSIISLLSKSKIFSLQPSSVTAQAYLCRTWSEILKTSFLTLQLISDAIFLRNYEDFFVVWFKILINVFSVMSEWSHSFLWINQYYGELMCLVQNLFITSLTLYH